MNRIAPLLRRVESRGVHTMTTREIDHLVEWHEREAYRDGVRAAIVWALLFWGVVSLLVKGLS
jgi:hypothetical protein